MALAPKLDCRTQTMQGGRGGRGGRDPFFNFGDPFGGFGSFGGQPSLIPNFFGGRDPFDDPFFTRPFGSMFESSFFAPAGRPFAEMPAAGFLEHQVPQPSRPRGPIIEEINSDDEREGKEKKDNPRKHCRSTDEPYVEDPDDEAEGRKSKHMQYRNAYNRVDGMRPQPQTHSFTFQSSTVTYGGTNGAYYTSSKTRRTGSDGLALEESKEADTSTGQATHNISRGIYDKGHSVTRKLHSGGNVDTMQTLHNLNEDELAGFDDAWKVNARKHLPGWSEKFNALDSCGSCSSGQNSQAGGGGWALPSTEHLSQPAGEMNPRMGERAGSSHAHLQHAGPEKTEGAFWTGPSRGRG
ncbi:uncharacterized protein LOC131163727 [Malania oleifera]|uniref:uncharacterized protein LOC131163727 n=1 Tax=Malania oleifera TaxID=397392 RepID=UPI0025ADFBEA|nr:uncharacterized protein LOC131163727 [Malania oleifera]